MTHLADLPAWAALLTALLVLVGAGLTLIGAIGTLRFATFFERVHAPTLGTSWGTGAVALASIVCFSALGSRLVVHEILIGAFVTVTTPVTLMLLARAALYRDRTEGLGGVPPRTVLRILHQNGNEGPAGDGDEPKPSPPAQDI
jgi:multicomponent K+:H+ antiporter subunit G